MTLPNSETNRSWQYSTVHNCASKIIEEQTLWGQSVCRVWLPNENAVVRVSRSFLRPLEERQFAQDAFRGQARILISTDAGGKGLNLQFCHVISDNNLTILLLEAALHASPEGKGALGLLLNNPAFFPFQIPSMSGDFISKQTDQIDVDGYGLDDILIKLQ